MSLSLTILGSSSALPTSERSLPAHVLAVHERFFLIDCGEGTQILLRKNRIRLGKINHILISHLHGDHTFGLFGLLSSFSLLGRESDLHLYADTRLENILARHFIDFDIHLGFELKFHPLHGRKSERIFEDDKLTVDTIPLKHRIPTCGFLFREKEKLRNIRKDLVEKYQIPVREIHRIKSGGDYTLPDGTVISNDKLTFARTVPKSYAYCTDTRYYEGIVTKIRGVDVLFHEATYGDDQKVLARETFHSTAEEAALLASKAGVKKLLIGHFSARYKNPGVLLQQARAIFPETYLAEDGLRLEI